MRKCCDHCCDSNQIRQNKKENFDFIHRTPMTVIPVGAQMEIDCDVPKIEILEPGVS